MSSKDTIKTLKNGKAQLKAQLSRFKTFLDKLEDDESNFSQLSSRLKTIESTLNSFKELHIKSLNITEEENHTDLDDEFAQFEENYFEIVSHAELIGKNYSHVRGIEQSENANKSNSSSKINLPIIDLPVFRGEPEGWLQFYDTFETLIHNDLNLSNVQKFYYLKSCLRDKAEAVISSLEVTNDNYITAWEILKERFQNDKLIVHNHIRALFELSVVQKESFSQLRRLIDEVNKILRVLKSFKQPVDQWGSLLIYLISSKLDSNTKRQWESENIDKRVLPTVDHFLKFLAQRCVLLETLYTTKENSLNKSQIKPKSHSFLSQTANQSGKCTYCNDAHLLFYCPKFLALPVKGRSIEIKRLKLCLNCFRSNHLVENCLSRGCKYCGKFHNSLLCFKQAQSTKISFNQAHTNSDQNQATNQSVDNNQLFNQPHSSQSSFITISQSNSQHSNSKPLDNQENSCGSSSPVVLNCSLNKGTEVLLATAIIHILDHFGNQHQARVLLDSGSQSNFITSELCKTLKLPKHKIHLPVSGINQNFTQINHYTKTNIQSRNSSYQTFTTFLILDKITENLPTTRLDVAQFSVPSNITLADETFYIPGKIDILLGASLFYEVLSVGQIKQSNHPLIIQKTKLGWVITGETPPWNNEKQFKRQTNCNLSTISIQNQLKQFWEIENVSNDRKFSQEEEECEREFKENTKQDETGRFVVPILKKANIQYLGESYDTALKRFCQLERRLEKDPTMKQFYQNFMDEYHKLGHMLPVTQDDKATTLVCYLPHHGVTKQQSTTTKLRAVFDGSSKTSTNISLNDCLKVGPTIQPELFTILIRFRSFNVVLAADIEKMYRQVLIRPEERNLQRILWRPDPTHNITEYKLMTVTYGTASAPYLAIRALNEIAIKHSESSPAAAAAITGGFYVDDLLYGTSTVEEAIKLKAELQKVLSKGGFTLRKWLSNHQTIFTDDPKMDIQHFISNNDTNKTLGLHWHSRQDCLYYDINIFHNPQVTKRVILQTVSRIFDPLGLIGPCTITAKVILQELWKLNVDWDETLPNNHQTAMLWLKFSKQLNQINEISIPRHVVLEYTTDMQIHGFSDASELAYGACVYLRSTYNTQIQVRLLCAKSKVAPLKNLTIPKLELCAATLLCKLIERVKQSLQIIINKTYYWSDSTITLCWINGQPYQWKPFVSNRVADIQTLSKTNDWHHVATKENPADIISRGCTPEELSKSELWWNGPHWLWQNENYWPKHQFKNPKDIPETKRQIKITLQSTNNIECTIFDRFSSLTKLINVVSFVLRFKHNTLNKQNKILEPVITMPELNNTLEILIKIVQSECFHHEITCLSKNKQIDKTSKILSLNPFLQNGILRVGGRIKHSTFTHNQKHPILLPSKHSFTNILIKQEHLKHLHAGPHALLAALRCNYWIVSGLTTVKRILKSCIICYKTNPQSLTQLMGDLPMERVTASRPFLCTGIDYCGPFTVKANNLRSAKLIKVYVCIFVCFSTKATHLEVVSDLTTECFINCLKRFISRRGKPYKLFSDNATNFVGAYNRIKELYSFLIDKRVQNEITKFCNFETIIWKFIPAKSPHHGGLWEATVKSFKSHLKRVINTQVFNFENFITLTTQIEACLNSRPLTPLSSDPSDFQSLTPGHFLIFAPLTALPEPDLRQQASNRLSKYQQVTQTLQHFWSRWSTEYMSHLQQRSKWKTTTPNNLQIGQLVLCKEERLPPLQWRIGRISELFPGKDGQIRVVSVRTANTELKRSINKVCVLPVEL